MTTARTVRCHTCGARQRAQAPECVSCGATFRGLCPCGEVVGLYETACGACGTEVDGPRLPLRRHPYVILGRWVAGAAVVIAAAAWAFRPTVVEPWRLRDAALRLMDRAAYREAAREFDRVLELRPGDPEALVNLAICRSRLGRSPGACLEPVEAALALRPDMPSALALAAVQERRRGNVSQAVAYAARAAARDDAPAHVHRLRATLELASPAPDLLVAVRHLRLAVRRGDAEPSLRLLLAETLLRIHRRPGDAAPGDLRIDLERALDGLAGRAQEGRVLVVRARLLLALGRFDEAIHVVDKALGERRPDAPSGERAELEILRGRALYGRAGATPHRDLAVTGAVAEFTRALRATRDLPAAVEVAEILVAGGDGEQAARVLGDLVADGDPHGAFAAVQAGVLAQLDRVPEALAALGPAREVAPDDARYLLLEGRLLERDGRFVDAAARIAEALERDPLLTGARVARPVLDALCRGDDPEALARAQDELEALRSELGDHPGLLKGLARIRSAAGRLEPAREALETTVVQSPGDAEAWLLLAEVAERLGASERAARAYAETRRLRGGGGDLVRREIEAWLDAGDALTATLLATEGLRVRPDDLSLLHLRARGSRMLGRWEQVRKDLARVRSLGAGDGNLLLDLVRAEVHAGRRKEALALIDETLPGVEGDVRTLLLVLRARETAGPTEALRVARAQGPGRVLADLLLAHGLVAEAVTTLRAALGARPGDARATMLLVSALLDGAAGADASARSACRSLVHDLGPAAPDGLRAFVEGRLALAEQRYGDARTALSAAAEAYPREPLVLLAAGDAALRSGAFEVGLRWLRRAVVLPGTTRAGRLAAERLVSASRLPEARERAETLLREALAIDPAVADAGTRLSALLAARSAFDEAADVAELALEHTAPRSVELTHRAAAARLAAGRPDLALERLRELEAAGRSTAGSAVLRAFALIAQAQYDAAEAVLAEVGRTPELAVFAAVGEARILLLRDADAAAVRERIRGAGATDSGVPLALARLLVESGHPEDGLAAARAALQRFPSLAAVSLAARAQRELGLPRDAVDEARRFADDAPAEVRWEARLLHGELRLKLLRRRARETATLARECAAAEGVRPRTRLWARVLRAEALLAGGNLHLAESTADGVEAGWPETGATAPAERGLEARIRFVLGICALEADQPRRAATQLSRSLALRPDAAAKLGLAEALLRVDGEAARAHTLAREVTRAEPADPAAWDTRAEAARRAGQQADAESSWGEARTLFSAAGDARRRERARCDLRFARFLREEQREDEARAVAQRVVGYAAEEPEAVRARRFLSPE